MKGAVRDTVTSETAEAVKPNDCVIILINFFYHLAF